MILKEQDLLSFKLATMDEVGKVFLYGERVLRAIYSIQYADLYRSLLEEKWLDSVFEAGLVKTWICEDCEIEGVPLVVEHPRIPFEIHPAECTSHMYWLFAKTMVKINLELSRHGYLLRDSHPWNLMYKRGYPQFVDFSSIMQADKVPPGWLDGFREYFGVPIWLTSVRWNNASWKVLALEYRRQHTVGFGLMLFRTTILRKFLLGSLERVSRFSGQPYKFFTQIDRWLEQHKPGRATKGYWAGYPHYQTAPSVLDPHTIKQRFVFDVLTRESPAKVLDCAANKGFYAEMAAQLGSSVAAFDYEEFCVDECLKLAQSKELDITPLIMDFKLPTPNYGMGLLKDSAFARLQADIVLAMGLVHHLCIVQRLPVKIFCETCMNYAKRGVVIEYVDPADKYVAAWGKPIPKDYSLESISHYFSKRFPKAERSETELDQGLCRTYIFFHD